jgi:adenylate cyclase, class 2
VNEALEVELKFPVADIDELRSRLIEVGARGDGEIFEDNLLLDDVEESLRRRGEMLRLRRDRRLTLTHKAPVSNLAFKTRVEREVHVDDFDGTVAILQAIGFHPSVRYQKFRQTFTLDIVVGGYFDALAPRHQVVITLDRLPFGTFCEIEGAPEAIEATARLLDLNVADASIEDYLALWERLVREKGSDVGGLIFASQSGDAGPQ